MEILLCDRTANKCWLKEIYLPYSTRGLITELITTNHAVVALDDKDNLIGIWKFHKNKRYIASQGTWVLDKYRKNGLGKLLWQVGIEWIDPKKIAVTVCSDSGNTLVSALREQFPQINWVIRKEINGRGLRDLRKKKGKISMATTKSALTARMQARKRYPISSRIAMMLIRGKTTPEIMRKIGCPQQAVAATYRNLDQRGDFYRLMVASQYKRSDSFRYYL